MAVIANFCNLSNWLWRAAGGARTGLLLVLPQVIAISFTLMADIDSRAAAWCAWTRKIWQASASPCRRTILIDREGPAAHADMPDWGAAVCCEARNRSRRSGSFANGPIKFGPPILQAAPRCERRARVVETTEGKMKAGKVIVLAVTSLLMLATTHAQDSPKMKMTTDIPASITTPDKVETRIGTLKFEGGYPDAATVEKVYDNLDFERGMEAYLNTMQGASLVALRRGFRETGAVDGTIGMFNTLMDSKSLFLTANADTVYAMTWIDLSKGPVVIESPPNSLGIMDDFWFRYVADLGNAGPDKGKGGKYLFLPPGYKGPVPEGYFVFKSRTFGNAFFTRGFLVNGDPAPAVESFTKTLRSYPLSEAGNPHPAKFVNWSGKAFNTIGSNDFSFYEDINQLVQEEPADSEDPELLGQLLAIGIQKGVPFAPDQRMKKILTDAVAVGNATARAIEFRSRNAANFYYPGKAWFIPDRFLSLP